ncbi:MAG: hypothetical protein M3276_08685 [Actinomycetota bacterium]|nr:hypothetical protein [Actinomycetota bacterium]
MSAMRLLPWVVHEAIEYGAGIFFLLAGFIFGFEDEPAFPVFIGVGVVILLVAVLSRGPASVVDILPAPVHAALDYVIGFFLILAPFLFAFRDITAAMYASILLGVAHLVVTLVTRFPTPAQESGAPAGE